MASKGPATEEDQSIRTTPRSPHIPIEMLSFSSVLLILLFLVLFQLHTRLFSFVDISIEEVGIEEVASLSFSFQPAIL